MQAMSFGDGGGWAIIFQNKNSYIAQNVRKTMPLLFSVMEENHCWWLVVRFTKLFQ
jgi:hypothetical protein